MIKFQQHALRALYLEHTAQGFLRIILVWLAKLQQMRTTDYLLRVLRKKNLQAEEAVDIAALAVLKPEIFCKAMAALPAITQDSSRIVRIKGRALKMIQCNLEHRQCDHDRDGCQLSRQAWSPDTLRWWHPSDVFNRTKAIQSEEPEGALFLLGALFLTSKYYRVRAYLTANNLMKQHYGNEKMLAIFLLFFGPMPAFGDYYHYGRKLD